MNYNLPARKSLTWKGDTLLQKKVLRVVWWNCGLSGLRRKQEREGKKQESKTIKKINEKIASIKDVIFALIGQSDILVLGEFAYYGADNLVNEYNLVHSCEKSSYGYIDLCGSISESDQGFDNVVIYNRDIVNVGPISRCVNVGSFRRIQRYRAYQVVAFNHLIERDFRFEVAVVHWSMRDGYGGDSLRHCKNKAAERLLRRMSTKSNYPYKIIVGDFNNEPYEEPFSWMVSARSMEYAEECRGLYNPFWKYMDGEHHTIYSPQNHDFQDNGAVFDNILVNSEFLGLRSRWILSPNILDALTLGYPMDKHDHHPISMDFSKV